MLIQGKKTVFSGYGGGWKGYFVRSHDVSIRGHLGTLHLLLIVFNRQSGRDIRVDRKFRVGPDTGTDRRLYIGKTLRITPL